MPKMKLTPPEKFKGATNPKRHTTLVQPRDPRLANRYNPTVVTDYSYDYPKKVKAVAVETPPPAPTPMQNDGFYTTDDQGNRVYDENTYTSGSSKAKMVKKGAIAKVPVPQFKVGVKKIVIKKK